MSFKSVQGSIARKEGVSEKAAGAILAKSSRDASPAAKKANPNLAKVKGGSRGKRSMRIEEHDDGTFSSHLREEQPSTKKDPYPREKEYHATHPSAKHLAQHVVQAFSPAQGPGESGDARPQSQWAGVANSMLGSGIAPAKTNNGAK